MKKIIFSFPIRVTIVWLILHQFNITFSFSQSQCYNNYNMFDLQDVPVFTAFSCSTTFMSENSVFIDPVNRNILVNTNNRPDDAHITTPCGPRMAGFVSSDAGTTWTGQEAIDPNSFADPSCVIDLQGLYYTLSLGSNASGLYLFSSTNGNSWTNDVLISPNQSLPDKGNLWIDNNSSSPYVNHLYAGWTERNSSNYFQIFVATSNTSSPSSWINLQNISNSIIIGNPSIGGNHAVNIKTAPNGDVYAVWAIYDNALSQNETGIGFSKSINGGTSWVTSRIPITIKGLMGEGATPQFGNKEDLQRFHSFPVMAVNQQNGHIYIVWANQGAPPPIGTNTGDADIYMIKSTDGGTTWSTTSANPPIRINSVTTNDQWKPWIACDPVTGVLAVIFYDCRYDPANYLADVFVALSGDDGNTFTDYQIDDNPYVPIGSLSNDYIGIAADNNLIAPVWTAQPCGGGIYTAITQPFYLDCLPTLTLCNATETGTAIYKASNTITVGGTGCNYHITNTANVTMHAGNEIILQDGFVADAGSQFHAYINTDCNLISARTANNNNNSGSSNTATTTTDKPITQGDNFKFTYYPNPFTDYLHIDFLLDKPSSVLVCVYNSQGQLIQTLANGAYQAGEYTLVFDNPNVKPGVYFVRLDIGDKHYAKAVLKNEE